MKVARLFTFLKIHDFLSIYHCNFVESSRNIENEKSEPNFRSCFVGKENEKYQNYPLLARDFVFMHVTNFDAKRNLKNENTNHQSIFGIG